MSPNDCGGWSVWNLNGGHWGPSNCQKADQELAKVNSASQPWQGMEFFNFGYCPSKGSPAYKHQ